MSDLGFAIVAGHRLEVVGVHLYDGAVHLICKGRGPLPAVTDAEVTFFGSDGRGVYQHPGLATWPKIGRRGSITVDVPYRVLEAIRNPAEVTP